jgi:O-antigen ligase
MGFSVKIPPPSLRNRLALAAFFISAIYAVLLWSPNVLGRFHPGTMKNVFFLLPWLMLWPAKGLEIFTNKEHRIEIILIIVIITLGIINVILSDNPTKSYYSMKTFLLGGVLALWVSMLLLTDPRHIKIFDWFCCICLAIVTIVEISAFLLRGDRNPSLIIFFVSNPIPMGTLLILLSVGLPRLWTSKNLRWVLVGGLLTALAFTLILLTEKRGTFLAIIVMGLAWLLFRRSKLSLVLAAFLIVIALLVPFKGISTYRSLDQNNPSHFNILYRLELYPFAWHIYQKHPVFGIGLRPYTHERYLSGYRSHQNLKFFPQSVKIFQTFDNMLVTAFVELGTLMTLVYLALITLIIARYCRKLRPFSQSRNVDLYRLLVIIGFAVHSMTYDSLLFPSINWLFHVQMGILTGYVPGTGSGLMDKQ